MSGTTLSPVQFGNPWAHAGVNEYTASLRALLPPGNAWSGTLMADFIEGMAAGFADLQMSSAQLSEVELQPATADVLLPFWLTDYGLPDSCTPLGATLQQQRNSLLAKIASVGGQTAAYYISVAAALGWIITITPGSVGSYTWTVNAPASSPPSIFRVGRNRAGDRLETITTSAQLQCVLTQLAPAHSNLVFSYA